MDKRARIVLVVPEFPAMSETFILNKFERLAASRDVYVFSLSSAKARNSGAGFGGRVRRAWPVRPLWKAAFFYPFLLLRSFIARPFKTLGYFARGVPARGLRVFADFYLDCELILLSPDLIHFEFGAIAAGKMYLKKVLGCRIAVSFRGYDLNYAGLDSPGYYGEVWQDADAVHLLGSDLWKRAQERGCPADKKKSLIPPAIDTGLFRPSPERGSSERRPLRLVSVGRLEWKKGHEFALAAAKILKDTGVEFEYRIIGAGRFLEAVSFCRHQLGLEKNVRLMGAVPQKAMLEHLEWADVFVHAAVSEGFCNAVLEAQAMKLPVVCTDADGLRENVDDGSTGFVVPRRAPEAMAEKIKALMNDPALRKRMGDAGRARVEKKFRLEDQITAFEKFYDDI